MNALTDWLTAHGSSGTELLGFITGVLNVYLVTRENIWSWPLGVLNALLYIVVFARSGLYSDTGLQVVYFVLSFYGWWHWLRGGPKHASVVVTRTSAKLALTLATLGFVCWMLVFTITSRIPGSKLPLLDAALAVSSLIAQWMMTRKLLENWAIWIVLDVVYVGVFLVRDLRLTALLYAVFLILAVIGHIEWKRSYARTSLA
ncbi:nicotinamide riboside transporter PnuC [Gemmatimonas sp.]|uniref:nicotinamide riboside transporter PnuC n=1 Tax=Gemmatimonas sp. TaxID=1962908 RepID=UPI003983584D